MPMTDKTASEYEQELQGRAPERSTKLLPPAILLILPRFSAPEKQAAVICTSVAYGQMKANRTEPTSISRRKINERTTQHEIPFLVSLCRSFPPVA
jgi:hypothetical protein